MLPAFSSAGEVAPVEFEPVLEGNGRVGGWRGEQNGREMKLGPAESAYRLPTPSGRSTIFSVKVVTPKATAIGPGAELRLHVRSGDALDVELPGRIRLQVPAPTVAQVQFLPERAGGKDSLHIETISGGPVNIVSRTEPMQYLAVGKAAVFEGSALSGRRGGFRLAVGPCFASGMGDVMDKICENSGGTEDFLFPVGLVIRPYYEFDFGLGVGLTIGPNAFFWMNDGDVSEDDFSWINPIGAFVRYAFLPKSDITPFIRGGVNYPIAGGGYLDHGNPGAVGAAGVEFTFGDGIGMSVEAGYDSSSVTIKSGPFGDEKDATYGGIIVAASVEFAF